MPIQALQGFDAWLRKSRKHVAKKRYLAEKMLCMEQQRLALAREHLRFEREQRQRCRERKPLFSSDRRWEKERLDLNRMYQKTRQQYEQAQFRDIEPWPHEMDSRQAASRRILTTTIMEQNFIALLLQRYRIALTRLRDQLEDQRTMENRYADHRATVLPPSKGQLWIALGAPDSPFPAKAWSHSKATHFGTLRWALHHRRWQRNALQAHTNDLATFHQEVIQEQDPRRKHQLQSLCQQLEGISRLFEAVLGDQRRENRKLCNEMFCLYRECNHLWQQRRKEYFEQIELGRRKSRKEAQLRRRLTQDQEWKLQERWMQPDEPPRQTEPEGIRKQKVEKLHQTDPERICKQENEQSHQKQQSLETEEVEARSRLVQLRTKWWRGLKRALSRRARERSNA